MKANSATPGAYGKGRARLLWQSGEESLEIHLDRQGFRRLLHILEQLAETGDRQIFEKSGRQNSRKNKGNSAGLPINQVAFSIDAEAAR